MKRLLMLTVAVTFCATLPAQAQKQQ